MQSVDQTLSIFYILVTKISNLKIGGWTLFLCFKEMANAHVSEKKLIKKWLLATFLMN